MELHKAFHTACIDANEATSCLFCLQGRAIIPQTSFYKISQTQDVPDSAKAG